MATQRTQLELSNPRQWLANVTADADGLSRLVRESGGMACAAYRLARARCSVESGAAPQLQDLQAAAALISARLGRHSLLPISSSLPATPDRARALSKFPAPAKVPSTSAESAQHSLQSADPSSQSTVDAHPDASRATL